MSAEALPELIDSHCHLNYDYSPKSAQDLIREAREQGVSTLMTIGTDMKTLEQVVSLSEQFEGVYHSVGMHPHDAIDFRDEHEQVLRDAAKHPKCRAIGEIGLDYHYAHSPREIQVQVLKRQLRIASEVGLPVVIHSREAEPELLEALKDYAANLAGSRIPGVIHCFTGTQAFGDACLDLGFYISFSGILTFKNAESLRECARAFPLDRLLVETDSPYLAPIPFRGKKCEPSMVKLTAMKLAELKGLSVEEVAAATTANAKKLFNLP